MRLFTLNTGGVILLICITACQVKNKKPVLQTQQVLNTFLLNAESPKYSIKERLTFALKADSQAAVQNNDQRRFRSLKHIADLALDLDSIPLAQSSLLKAIELAQKIDDQNELGIALNSLAAVYTSISEYEKALEYYNSAAEAFRKTHNRKYLAQTLSNIGVVLKNQGDFQRAFKTTIEAVKIFELEKNTQDLAAGYTTLGNILKEIGRFDDALYYHQMALQLMQINYDSVNISLSLNNIGNVFRYKKEYNNALNNYQKALKCNCGPNRLKTSGIITDNIGQTYLELKEYDSAKRYFLKALDLRLASGDKNGVLTTSNRLSKLYLETNDIREAKRIALNAFNLGSESNYLKQRLENNLMLLDIYSKLGEEKMALHYSIKSLAVKDSLFNADMADKISKMKVVYETEKKEIENISLKKDKIIDTVKIEEQKSQKITWIILSISIFIVSVLTFYTWKKQKNYSFEQQITATKQEALNAQVSDHFISNTMDSINNFIENNDKQKASEYLLLFHRLIRVVLENSFKNLIPLETEMEVLTMYIELEKLRFTQHKLNYTFIVDNNIDPQYTYVPPMIFQVFVENSIKHGFNKDIGGALIINVLKEGNCIKCSVEDKATEIPDRIQTKHKAEKKGISLGSSLAEKLINITWHYNDSKIHRISDFVNIEDNLTGRRVEFLLPYIFIT